MASLRPLETSACRSSVAPWRPQPTCPGHAGPVVVGRVHDVVDVLVQRLLGDGAGGGAHGLAVLRDDLHLDAGLRAALRAVDLDDLVARPASFLIHLSARPVVSLSVLFQASHMLLAQAESMNLAAFAGMAAVIATAARAE